MSIDARPARVGADDTSDAFALHPEPARLLAGRRALVTGATTGIGRGTALELAAHGAAVAIDHRGKEDEARAGRS